MAETKRRAAALSRDQRAAMSAVAYGADVYSYSIALRLREVQRTHPDLIDIGPAMGAPQNGAERQPYFGAILTAAGRMAIARLARARGGT
jgi:hypothetical protein